MYHSLIPLIGWGATFGGCALAWWKGERPEQLGAALKLATSLIALGVHHLLKQDAISGALLTADGVLAMGFLALTIRYASLWLGGVMLLQGVQFSLHAYFFVTKLTPGVTYAVVNNLVTCGTLLGILLGVGMIVKAYQIAEASRVSVFEYVILPASAAWGFILWGEELSWIAVLGMSLIVLAGVLIARPVPLQSPTASLQ